MTFTLKNVGWLLLALLFAWTEPAAGFPGGGRKDQAFAVDQFVESSRSLKPGSPANRAPGYPPAGEDRRSGLIGDPLPWTMWHAFLGSDAIDEGRGIAVDAGGNIYVVGTSTASWGPTTVRRQYSGGSDAFVAKLSPGGDLIWNTFLGSIKQDYGQGIAVDGSGNVYVTGYSNDTWGFPTREYSSGSNAFAAKLDTDGTLLWNTFLGSSSDQGQGIAVDGSGNVYVTGTSGDTWGDVQTIKRDHSGGNEAFVAKLGGTINGELIWNTFLGSAGQDYGQGIALDGNGNAYVVGTSGGSWGAVQTIRRDHSGLDDAFVAKLNSAGVLQWNTFLGSGNQDYGSGIAVDLAGMVFVTGESAGHWQGSSQPVRQWQGNLDAFAAKLDTSGVLVWNTFLGSGNQDYGRGVAVDRIGNVFVSGYSGAVWEEPLSVRGFSGSGNFDGFAAKLDGGGNLVWNSFLGSSSNDYGCGIAVDGSGNVCVVGFSDAAWVNPPPVRGFTPGGSDAFVARLTYNLLTISGRITEGPSGPGLAGVVLTGLPLSPLSDGDGRYAAIIDSGWSGTATPILTGYSFNPPQRDYNAVIQEMLGQDYVASPAPTHLISGYIKAGESAMAGVTVTASLGGSTVTDIDGYYEIRVNEGWSVTVTPSQDGCTFSPPSLSYNPVTQDEHDQDYQTTLMSFTVSGTVTFNGNPLPDVQMSGFPGNPVITNGSGVYSASVNFGWSGTVTPTKAGYSFTPDKVVYSHVKKSYSQNYTAVLSYIISGHVWVGGLLMPGVSLIGFPGNPVVTNASGVYTATVPLGWSGIAIPTLAGYNFSPPNLPYSNVTANYIDQDYTGIRVFTISGTITAGPSGPGLPGVVLDGPPEYTVTDGSGLYSATVYEGWTGTVTPIRTGYRFTPASMTYLPMNSDQPHKDFVGVVVPTYTIAGLVTSDGLPLAGVTLTASPGEATVTGADGIYQLTVNEDWSGTVTPAKEAYRFSPEVSNYDLVRAHQMDQDFAAIHTCTTSGYVREKGQPLPGVTLTVNPGNSTFSDGAGRYQITVDKGWSGTITPTPSGSEFSPPSRVYNQITLDRPSQDFSIGAMVYLPIVLKPN